MRISDWSSDVCSSDLAILDDLQEKHPDNGDLLTAIVLSASPTKITVARTANEIIDITDKGALRVVARGLVKNAKDNVRIERGSVVYVHKNGDQIGRAHV